MPVLCHMLGEARTVNGCHGDLLALPSLILQDGLAKIVHYKSIADLGDGMAGVKCCTCLLNQLAVTLISVSFVNALFLLTQICISYMH